MAEQASAKLTVTSAASAGGKGAYVQALASTNFTSKWVEVTLVTTGNLTGKQNVDVAVGAAASEVDKMIEIPFQSSVTLATGADMFQSISWPFQFAAGSRLAVRVCDTNASAIAYTIQVRIIDY